MLTWSIIIAGFIIIETCIAYYQYKKTQDWILGQDVLTPPSIIVRCIFCIPYVNVILTCITIVLFLFLSLKSEIKHRKRLKEAKSFEMKE